MQDQGFTPYKVGPLGGIWVNSGGVVEELELLRVEFFVQVGVIGVNVELVGGILSVVVLINSIVLVVDLKTDLFVSDLLGTLSVN